MIRLSTPLLLSSTLALMLVSASAAQAGHHEGEDPALKYRQSVMSIIGTNMGAIGDIMKNRLELQGAVANHAGQMAESAALIAPAFKKKITQGSTDAKGEIWTDWAKFEAAVARYEEAARNLQTAASGNDSGAVGPAMRALGKSCGGCHKAFRKAKEDSYKKK
jgi:cytochrome c556